MTKRQTNGVLCSKAPEDCSRAPYTSGEALWCTLFEGRIVGRGVPHRLEKEMNACEDAGP